MSERAKRRARDAPFGDVGSACVDIRPPSKTDVLVSIFHDGGRPPSSITYTTVWTTHEEHLVVFVTVQNLVGISGVVSVFVRSFFAVRGPAC